MITTILPTFRRPVLLKRAVLSVLNQSFADFNIQILDNASGDGTEDVAHDLMRMDSRIQYHRHAENLGQLNNLIYGMERVTTPYFNVLCDDDLLMPEFFATGLRLHEEGDGLLAFVSTKVVVLDEDGAFSTPFAHPGERCCLSPPAGVARCLKSGVSLPGVIYRTSAIQEVGLPRTAWWNWTESGWHALAALAFPVAFTPAVGAIMYNHRASGSKRMDGVEFRLSWFRMLVDVREAALRSGVSDMRWRTEMLSHQYAKFVSTCLRISRGDGSRVPGQPRKDDELRELGIRSGLDPFAVSAAVRVAGAIRSAGVGAMLNGAIDRVLIWRDTWMRTVRHQERPRSDSSLASASSVLLDLNGQAGVASHRGS